MLFLRTKGWVEIIKLVILWEPKATEESLKTRCFAALSMTENDIRVGTAHQFLRTDRAACGRHNAACPARCLKVIFTRVKMNEDRQKPLVEQVRAAG